MSLLTLLVASSFIGYTGGWRSGTKKEVQRNVREEMQYEQASV